MSNYDEYISLGSNCGPGLSLRKLNLKSETYPFDWVRSNSKIIYDVLCNGYEKYLTFDTAGSDDYYTKDLDKIDFNTFQNSHINLYGQYFTHYTHENNIIVIQKFKNYMDRFFKLLNSNKRVLFIHSHEEYIYHKKSRDNKNEFYDYLCKINDHLVKNYPNLKFKIVNVDIFQCYTDYGNIKNVKIEYKFPFSDNSETHLYHYYDQYRNSLTNSLTNFI